MHSSKKDRMNTYFASFPLAIAILWWLAALTLGIRVLFATFFITILPAGAAYAYCTLVKKQKIWWVLLAFPLQITLYIFGSVTFVNLAVTTSLVDESLISAIYLFILGLLIHTAGAASLIFGQFYKSKKK